MRAHTQIGYGLQSGIAGVGKHRAASITSVVTTAACLLLISGLIMLAWNVHMNLESFQSENTMLAFVDDRLTQLEAIRLQPYIEEIDGVKSAVFITKEEAFDTYIAQYENEQTVVSHMGPTILRDRYAVEVRAQADAAEVAERLKTEVEGIADVRLDETVTRGFAVIQRVVVIVGLVVAAMLLMVSTIIMTNTIKLTTMARKEEIEVMKMMGAYDSFVQLPFLCEGCIVGMSGALIAFVLSIALYAGMTGAFGGAGALSLISIAPFSKLAAPIFVTLTALGLGVGIVGSRVAVKRYLSV